MGKSKECEIVFNTKYGYIFQPIKCKSITEALRLAEERGEAYRIFCDGKLIRRGWIIK